MDPDTLLNYVCCSLEDFSEESIYHLSSPSCYPGFEQVEVENCRSLLEDNDAYYTCFIEPSSLFSDGNYACMKVLYGETIPKKAPVLEQKSFWDWLLRYEA